MSIASNLTRFPCTLCDNNRTFKSKAGLQRHENIKHSDYKDIPTHILLVPEYELLHVKHVIVKEIQKRLKNHYSNKGGQVFSIHCSENCFIGIFGQYLTRYSVCGGWYRCFFDGEEAIDQLAEIFKDVRWAERNYENRQLSWVKLCLERGILIEWKIRGFSDKAGHRCESGEATFRFIVDQGQF
ncbi:hypothetical protein C2G38_2174769 [Gigaspora rosea]|uniref:C2H2-type domain-containing protein n=1 Tax=Gigaspora rosea TaxID=44941 RepID=A0A397VQC4_9GLOM|nr:hypothetical protein C2G38_2174769 [Gigaspora rosea]